MGVSSAALITAWNPRSEILTEDENDERQRDLLSNIEQMRLNYLVGYCHLEDWLEYSYLILGIDKKQATTTAKKFEQYAYVWISSDGIPVLVAD